LFTFFDTIVNSGFVNRNITTINFVDTSPDPGPNTYYLTARIVGQDPSVTDARVEKAVFTGGEIGPNI